MIGRIWFWTWLFGSGLLKLVPSSKRKLPDERSGRGGWGRVIDDRQSGHEGLDLSHLSTHDLWNACLQAGSNRSSASGINASQQTAQSSDDLVSLAILEASLMRGRESISFNFSCSDKTGAPLVAPALELVRVMESRYEEPWTLRMKSRMSRWMTRMLIIAIATIETIMNTLDVTLVLFVLVLVSAEWLLVTAETGGGVVLGSMWVEFKEDRGAEREKLKKLLPSFFLSFLLVYIWIE